MIVLDDDDAVRRALALLLKAVGLRVKAYASAQAFLAAGRPAQPGCLIAAAQVCGMCAMTLQVKLEARRVTIPVIFTSSNGDVTTAVEAMKYGAFDFLEMPLRDETLLDRVDAALRLSSAILRRAEARQHVDRCLGSLTARERDALSLVAAGASNRSMASALRVAQRTVEIDRSRVMDEKGAHSLAQLVQMMAQFQAAIGPGGRRGTYRTTSQVADRTDARV